MIILMKSKKSGRLLREYKIKIKKSHTKNTRDMDIKELNKCGRYLYYVLSCGNDEKIINYYQKSILLGYTTKKRESGCLLNHGRRLK